MASSPNCFVIVTLAVLLQLLFVSASTKPIDAICKEVADKAFCVQTLSAYPPAVSASTTLQAAQAALNLGMSYAGKAAKFAAKAAQENPNLKKQFAACQDAFVTIVTSLRSAGGSELKTSPDTSNYDVMVCTDSTTIVRNLVGKNGDVASKTIIKLTLMMEKIIAIDVGATVAVGG